MPDDVMQPFERVDNPEEVAARADLEWALGAFANDEQRRLYQLHRDYYAGRQRLAFATEKFRNTFGPLFQAFADNVCAAPVDVPVQRMRLLGMDARPYGEAVDAKAVAAAAGRLYDENRLDRRQVEVHREALRAGDAYVLVWPDADGRQRVWPHAAESMRVRYPVRDDSDPAVPECAAKLWREKAGDERWRHRLTIYTAERVFRWHAVTGQSETPKADRWSLLEVPSVHGYERVPVFHFAFRADEGTYGRSILADVVPLQDALNKAVADLLVTMEFHALPLRWATGVTVQYGEDGEEQAPFQIADRLWTSGNKDTQLGQLDPADLEPFLQVQETFRVEVARLVGLPLWYVVPSMDGTPPSGEALKVSEARLVALVDDAELPFGNEWEDAFRTMLAHDRSPLALPPGALTATWAPASTPDPKYDAEAAEAKLRAGVSKRQVLREMGYDEDVIELMLAEREQDAEAAAVGFDRGLRAV